MFFCCRLPTCYPQSGPANPHSPNQCFLIFSYSFVFENWLFKFQWWGFHTKKIKLNNRLSVFYIFYSNMMIFCCQPPACYPQPGPANPHLLNQCCVIFSLSIVFSIWLFKLSMIRVSSDQGILICESYFLTSLIIRMKYNR